MKISQTPTDLIASSDQLVVWSERPDALGGQVERVGVESLVRHLANQPQFLAELTNTEYFKSLLQSELLKLLASAGFATEDIEHIASQQGVYYNPGYVVPGQSLPPAESGVAVGGTVDVEA